MQVTACCCTARLGCCLRGSLKCEPRNAVIRAASRAALRPDDGKRWICMADLSSSDGHAGARYWRAMLGPGQRGGAQMKTAAITEADVDVG